MIVIDASVAIKWVVRELHHEVALALVELPWERIAPDLLLPEVTNVLGKKQKKGEIAAEQAAAGLSAIDTAISHFIPSRELTKDAAILSIELNHPAYDCFYLACALGRGILVSADKRFIDKCRQSGYEEVVTLLGDFSCEELAARIGISSIAKVSMETIKRLASNVESTVSCLIDNLGIELSGGLRRSNSSDMERVFDSPAYLRLSNELERMNHDELSVIIALGWLGRPHHRASEYPELYKHARDMTDRGFDAHRSYFMAQSLHVSDGLSKLRAYVNGLPDR